MAIKIFDGSNFTGANATLETGKYPVLPTLGLDRLSSVKVERGTYAEFFITQGFRDSSFLLFEGEYPNLGIFGFDNVAPSLQIVQNNLEVTNIEYINQVFSDGEPILIESTAQNGSSLPQQANLTLQTAYEETFTRSFSNSTLFGLEISRTATVGVQSGPLSASLSQTITATFEKTFTFGREETKSKTITVSKGLVVTIPPENIAKAFMTLTPRRATIEAIYTLRLKGTDRTTKQKVTIEVESASVGTVVIEKFTLVEA
ncbi:MAG: beta/gamma crystallin-related protein [Saprospiraceae bacterium]|nr:hypothetical protein [Lewinella sp.]